MNLRPWQVLIAGAALLLCFLFAAWALQDTTYYAPGFTEKKFRSLRIGMPESEVIRILGTPIKASSATEYIEWIYGPSSLGISEDGGLYVSSDDPSFYTIVTADGSGKITSVTGTHLKLTPQSLIGHSLSEMEAQYGKPLRILAQPSQRYLIYSGTKVSGSYYIRNIGLDKTGCVNNIVARFYQD